MDKLMPLMPRSRRLFFLSGINMYIKLFFLLLVLLPPVTIFAQETTTTPAQNRPPAVLDQEIQALKKDVMELNRDLFLLEEELLFPASTQISVYLSLDIGNFFALDSVQLKLDDKIVSNYLYTEREMEALRRGGIHQLFIGNVPAGKHELVALFTGVGPEKRNYKQGANLIFEKGLTPKYIELKISDKESKQQPEFIVKEWQ